MKFQSDWRLKFPLESYTKIIHNMRRLLSNRLVCSWIFVHLKDAHVLDGKLYINERISVKGTVANVYRIQRQACHVWHDAFNKL